MGSLYRIAEAQGVSISPIAARRQFEEREHKRGATPAGATPLPSGGGPLSTS